MKDALVIGSGIAGLSLAYRLSRQGKDVHVLESGDVAGGVVRTEKVDGYLIEHGPNSALSNHELSALIDDLGLRADVLEPGPGAKKRFLALPDAHAPGGLRIEAAPMGPKSAFSTPLLSARGKARALVEPFMPRSTKDDESVFDFCSRRFGREVAEKLFGAMLSGIWASDITKLSARSALPVLWELEQGSGSVIRGAFYRAFHRPNERRPKHKRKLTTFGAGMDVLTHRLSDALGPGALSLSAKVSRIAKVGETWTVSVEHAGRQIEHTARNLVLALPAKDAAALLTPISGELARRIAEIPYAPLGVLHLAFDRAAVKHALDGFGFLVAPFYGKALLGAIFSSSLFSGRAPAGKHLLTCFVGGASKPQYADVTRPENSSQAVRELMQLIGASAEPEVVRRTYWEEAIPNYPIGHYRLEQKLVELERQNAGLHLLGNWRRGISVSDRVKEAQLLASKLL